MKDPKKSTFIVMLLVSLLYFCAFIFPNLQGAKDVDMLAVFEVDEYAQFPALQNMLSGGDTLKQTVRNFLVYGHYFYGYPFFLVSGLVLLPIRAVLGVEWSASTQLSLLLLRQLVNVLPNLLATWLLTFWITRLKVLWKSMLIFSLLLLTPALVNNGFWWHLDGLGLLMVASVLVCLQLDDLRFGRFFFCAAACAGVAAAIKYLGLFFFLSIPAYLLMGIRQKRIDLRAALVKGLFFLLIMLLTVLLTNPLLFLQERTELISTQLRQFSRTSQGELIGQQPFLEDGRLPAWLTEQYGHWFFLLLCCAGLVAGLRKPQFRLSALLIALFILPLTVVILNGALQRSHYWLPVILPMIASLGFLLPDELPRRIRSGQDMLPLLMLTVIFLQAGAFAFTDFRYYENQLNREAQSASLAFYRTVRQKVVEPLAGRQPIRVYRDWKVYFPSQDRVATFMDWELASYDLLEEMQPDLVLLEKVNVRLYGAPDFLANAADPIRQAPMHQFYADALVGKISGYSLVFADEFGLVFQRQALNE